MEAASSELSPELEIQRDRAKIRRNALLSRIYGDVYERILAQLPPRDFPRLLELGSGGGFFKEVAPHAITSECVPIAGIERVVDACRLESEFSPDSLDAVAAFNVFHHLPDAAAFLRGVTRVLRSGGRLCLVEPWFTPVGQWFHRVLHHEPYRKDPSDWRLVGAGRMTGANSRLPTSVFRDSKGRLAEEFPELRVVQVAPFHKWLYLLSGGLRLNTKVPAPLAAGMVRLDRMVRAGDQTMGLFALIVVEKADPAASVRSVRE